MSDKPNLIKLAEHKIKFQTEQMKVPVIFHTSENLLPDNDTFRQLENLARDEDIFHHIAAMSDVHPKKGRKNPTGTVVASQNYLFPQVNDTAPNCGMRIIKTNLTTENCPIEKIDELFEELVKTVPTKKYIGTKIPYCTALDVGKFGSPIIQDYFKTRTNNEIENCFKNGNFFGEEKISTRELLDVIPRLFFQIGKMRLGILGAAGNHFLDLMKITEIKNTEIAQKFGIEIGQYIFVIHTGSGLLGQYASYLYTPKIKEHLSQKIMLQLGIATSDSKMQKMLKILNTKINQHKNKSEFFAYEEESMEGKMFLRAHRAAANFGFANRSVINHQIDQSLEKIMGGQVDLDMLYDMPHIFIDKEKHYSEDVWIHRNGAVRANGPARMTHPLFSKTGEPVVIPSSMTTPAYLGVGMDENESGFFSAGHGTGRRREAENNAPASKSDLFKKVSENNVKLYNAKSKGVILQDSAYYKDIEEVMADMVDNKIVKVVAKMQPVAVMMY